MNYLGYFGLREAPFSLTPDTSFFFSHASHREALNTLRVALDSGEGFIRVSGEVGTGKTMLCRMLLASFGEHEQAVYIPNPHLQSSMLRVAVARELGIGAEAIRDDAQLLSSIQERLIELAREGKRVVVCLDEAQAMPDATLEALRLLTNLETEKRKLLQVVLFGQPELEQKLAKPELRQVRQRIAWSYRLQPYERRDIEAYVAHRLTVAGYDYDPLFSPRALDALQRASGGVPRLINILAHKSMMLCYGRGDRRVHDGDVTTAAEDTDDALAARRRSASWWLLASGVAVLFAGVWVLWTGPGL